MFSLRISILDYDGQESLSFKKWVLAIPVKSAVCICITEPSIKLPPVLIEYEP